MHRRRLVRVPASSANLGPGFDVLAAALGLHLELEVAETGRFAVHTDLAIARDRRNLVRAGVRALHPADDFEFTIRSDVPLVGRAGHQRRRLRGRADGRRLAVRAGRRRAGRPDQARGPSRQRGRRAAGRLRGLRGRARGALRRPGRAGGGARRAPPPRAHRQGAGGDARRRCRSPTPCTTSGAPASWCWASLRGDWELVAEGLHDRLHQPRRASLYPQSMALLRRARELGALGATISGAGPTVLVWTHYEATGAVVGRLKPATAGWAQVVHVPFEPQGADVRAL